MSSTTAYLSDGRSIDVPADDVLNWQYEARNGDTTLGLADWYTDSGDEHPDEIEDSSDPDTLCKHPELTHRIVNESQTGDYDSDKPCRMARVCHRRACILDGLAWVERGTGERAAWAAPHGKYSFDVPKDIPSPVNAPSQPAPVCTGE